MNTTMLLRGARALPGLFWMLVLLAALAGPARPSMAERMEPAPDQLVDIGVDEHLEAELPLDLEFTDSRGNAVLFGDFFDGKRPVILTLNYSNCPMLCSLQLNGLFDGLQGVDWNLGEEYRMITVSIDPEESPERAEETRQKYLKIYGRTGVEDGWHCLVGEEANIRKLAEKVGFGYSYVPETQEYAHAAVTMICTPDGRMSRYLYGVEYPAQTLKLSLLEASEGKIGSTMDKVLLFCFQYDETKGQYGPAALNLMRAGGVVTLIVLGGILAVYWRRESRKAKRSGREVAESVS